MRVVGHGAIGRSNLVAVLYFLLCASALAQGEFDFDVRFGDTVIAAGSNGLAAGDRIILNDTLLQEGAEVGSIHGVCTITDPDGYALCNVTFVLPNGTVATQFVNSPPPEKHFPMLAGTGAYAGLGGAGILVEHGDGTGSLSLSLVTDDGGVRQAPED